MDYTAQLEEAVEAALKLTPKDRLRLIERVASSVEREIPDAPSEEHWGRKLNALLDSFGPIEFVDPEITDPVEWVKAQRRKEADRLKPYWTGENDGCRTREHRHCQQASNGRRVQ
jgi:hypothetical protein